MPSLLTVEEKETITKKTRETNKFASVVATTVARLYRADMDPGKTMKQAHNVSHPAHC